jgi:hypothetical protein
MAHLSRWRRLNRNESRLASPAPELFGIARAGNPAALHAFPFSAGFWGNVAVRAWRAVEIDGRLKALRLHLGAWEHGKFFLSPYDACGHDVGLTLNDYGCSTR